MPAESTNASIVADPSAAISAVIFDLDDTLYLQGDWLAGAWVAVAQAAAAEHGADADTLAAELARIAAEGSDGGGIIDRGFAVVGLADVDVAPFVQVFLTHQPESLPLLPGVPEMLADLRAGGVRVAIVTDGAIPSQQAKVASLGVADLVDAVIMSDEFGRQFRKPHPRPVLEALKALGADPGTTVMIGDRPAKDAASASGAGVRAIRVRTGEYTDAADHPFTWRTADDAPAAIAALRADGLLP